LHSRTEGEYKIFKVELHMLDKNYEKLKL
jgi:hypothetical protein